MFKSVKRRLASTRIAEEQLYAFVLDELKNNIRRDGLWAKAIAKSDGHEGKAKALYMQYRVQSLKDEYELLRDIEGVDEYQDQAHAVNKKVEEIEDTNIGELDEDEINRSFAFFLFIVFLVFILYFFYVVVKSSA